jgi:hypothetical protein
MPLNSLPGRHFDTSVRADICGASVCHFPFAFSPVSSARLECGNARDPSLGCIGLRLRLRTWARDLIEDSEQPSAFDNAESVMPATTALRNGRLLPSSMRRS